MKMTRSGFYRVAIVALLFALVLMCVSLFELESTSNAISLFMIIALLASGTTTLAAIVFEARQKNKKNHAIISLLLVLLIILILIPRFIQALLQNITT
jgi:accessory gene regulator protein AgrB